VFWGAVLALVPLTYLGSLAPQGAMPVAEGCSGASSVASKPTGVYGINASLDALPVDERGFFTFWINARELDAGPALEAMSLEAKNALGEIVPGQARILTEQKFAEVLELLVAWEADATLPPGTVLQVNATATSSSGPVSMKTVLTVQDQVLALPEPDLQFDFWNEVTRDVGELQSCLTHTMCGNQNESQSFGAELEQVVEVSLTAPVPASMVAVAWRYSVAEIDGKGSFANEPASWSVFVKESGPLGAQLTFEERLDEYCVLVTAVDLRTENTKSAELCGKPPAPLEPRRQDAVQLCSTAPAGFTERWCQAPERQSAPECAPYVKPGAPGAGGATGTGGSTAATAGTGGSVSATAGTGGSVSATAGTGGSVSATAGTGGSVSATAGSATAGSATAGSAAATAASAEADDSDGARRTSKAGCAMAAPRARGSLLAFASLTLLTSGFALRRRRAPR
jgi:hypothetical protein